VGGYAAYGLIENCSDNELHAGLPICLADEVIVRRAIRTDEKIFLDDVTFDDADRRFETFGLAMGTGSMRG
jgi:predicted homoserine dehydrogenase-like protein